MREAEMLKKKRTEERVAQLESLKMSKKAQGESEGLLKVCRSILKTYLLPVREAVLKGIVKNGEREHEFSIDCNNIDQKELHDQVWRNITKYT